MGSKSSFPNVDDVIDKALAQGFERGFEPGWARDFEGMITGMTDMFLFILGERFTVTAETRAWVEKNASIANLEQWGQHAVTAQWLYEVFAED